MAKQRTELRASQVAEIAVRWNRRAMQSRHVPPDSSVLIVERCTEFAELGFLVELEVHGKELEFLAGRPPAVETGSTTPELPDDLVEPGEELAMVFCGIRSDGNRRRSGSGSELSRFFVGEVLGQPVPQLLQPGSHLSEVGFAHFAELLPPHPLSLEPQHEVFVLPDEFWKSDLCRCAIHEDGSPETRGNTLYQCTLGAELPRPRHV